MRDINFGTETPSCSTRCVGTEALPGTAEGSCGCSQWGLLWRQVARVQSQGHSWQQWWRGGPVRSSLSHLGTGVVITLFIQRCTWTNIYKIIKSSANNLPPEGQRSSLPGKQSKKDPAEDRDLSGRVVPPQEDCSVLCFLSIVRYFISFYFKINK